MTKPHIPNHPDILTTRQAADLIGVNLRSIQLWVESGKLAACKTPGGHRRIQRADVLRLLAGPASVSPAPVPTMRRLDAISVKAIEVRLGVNGGNTPPLADIVREVERELAQVNGMQIKPEQAASELEGYMAKEVGRLVQRQHDRLTASGLLVSGSGRQGDGLALHIAGFLAEIEAAAGDGMGALLEASTSPHGLTVTVRLIGRGVRINCAKVVPKQYLQHMQQVLDKIRRELLANLNNTKPSHA